jgi:hypothetical protein
MRVRVNFFTGVGFREGNLHSGDRITKGSVLVHIISFVSFWFDRRFHECRSLTCKKANRKERCEETFRFFAADLENSLHRDLRSSYICVSMNFAM